MTCKCNFIELYSENTQSIIVICSITYYLVYSNLEYITNSKLKGYILP